MSQRWARAYHIDAFFQYLLGNSRSYFTQVPKGPDALLIPRDGVHPEDDLALRALLPDLRPKRGRRKANEDDTESIDTPNKRLRVGTPSTVDGRNSPSLDMWGRVSQSPAPSYIPHPSNSHIPQGITDPSKSQATPVYDHGDPLTDLFSAAARAFGGDALETTPAPAIPSETPHMQHMNPWPEPNGRSHNEYPQSAIDLHPPASVFDSPDLNDGSRSAHPLAVSNSRAAKSKRISAMWNTLSSFDQAQETHPKPRGRPPQHRHMKNGPFETWSVKQSIETDRTNGHAFFSNGGEDTRQQQAAPTPPMQQSDVDLQITTSTSRRIPTQKLSLTVPQQTGGHVRLATPPVSQDLANNPDANHPPPRLTLNDDGSFSRPRSSISRTREQESVRERARQQRSRLFAAEDRSQRRSSADFFNVIDEDTSQYDEYDMDDNDVLDENSSNANGINWKYRAQVLARRLKYAQDELRRVKKAVLEAVM